MSLVPRIAASVMKQCRAHGIGVTEKLSKFVVRSTVLEDEYAKKFSLDGNLKESEISELVNICCQKLLQPDSPSLETIKMQVSFDEAHAQSEETLLNYDTFHEQQYTQLLTEIVESKVRGPGAQEGLYRKMVAFCIVRSNVGNPTNIVTVRETTAALESVFPSSEMPMFLSMSKKEKAAELQELASIVLGIRLFNKETGNGGTGIEDVRTQVTAFVHNLGTHMLSQRAEALAFIQGRTRYCEDLRANKVVVGQEAKEAGEAPKHVRVEGDINPTLARLKDEIANKRQLVQFVDILMHTLGDVKDASEETGRELNTAFASLRQSIQARTAVPTDQVYPKFIVLADHWRVLMKEKQKCKGLETVFKAMEPFSRSYSDITVPDPYMDETNPEALNASGLPKRTAAIPSADLALPAGVASGVELLTDDSFDAFNALLLEYNGFCPVTAVGRQGLLLPGDPHLGVILYRDHAYAFESLASRNAFALDPEQHILDILTEAKHAPELITLLGLEACFPTLMSAFSSAPARAARARAVVHPLLLSQKIEVTDTDTQTPTHFVEAHIDKNYEWNEWELRRKAIKLADLRTKKTHSMQTDASHFRRENTTQHYPQKTKSVQTGVNASTGTATVKRHIGGMRDPASKVSIVTLSLDP